MHMTLPWTNDRKSKRRAIRGELAEIELRRRRADELSKEITALDERADRAADLHASRCEPLQQELAAVELAIKSAITDRLKVAKGDERRRQELLDEVADANEDLEREVQLVASLRKPLAKERHECQMANTRQGMLENQLAGEELGDPETLAQQHIVKQRIAWLHQRHRVAQTKVAEAKAWLADCERHQAQSPRLDYGRDIATATKRIKCWSMETEAVEAELQDADQASRRIRQALLAE